jgi:hypothetical protein
MNTASNCASFASVLSVNGNVTSLQRDSSNRAYYTRGGPFIERPFASLLFEGYSATMKIRGEAGCSENNRTLDCANFTENHKDTER